MRYMIAHMIQGDAAAYHNNLSRALASAYRLRPVTANIDPHLTIKAPFDALSTDLFDAERITERFARARSPIPYTLRGFGNFHDRVVFMGVEAGNELTSFILDLKESLRELPWLEFKEHEQEVKPHATLCYPRGEAQTNEIVSRLTERGGKEFTAVLDRIALLKKGDRRWEVIKEFPLGGSDGISGFVV